MKILLVLFLAGLGFRPEPAFPAENVTLESCQLELSEGGGQLTVTVNVSGTDPEMFSILWGPYGAFRAKNPEDFGNAAPSRMECPADWTNGAPRRQEDGEYLFGFQLGGSQPFDPDRGTTQTFKRGIMAPDLYALCHDRLYLEVRSGGRFELACPDQDTKMLLKRIAHPEAYGGLVRAQWDATTDCREAEPLETTTFKRCEVRRVPGRSDSHRKGVNIRWK